MSPMSGRRRALALLALTLAALLIGPASSAWAHAELVSSDPADGSTITALPAKVSLRFGEDLIAEGSGLTARSLTADRAIELAPAVQGDTISAAWPAGTPSGNYQVDYRVVSQDGHPVEGHITFTLTFPVGGATVTVGPAPTTAGATPSESATATSTAPADESSGGSSLIAWIVGFVVVVAIGAASGTWIMKRANRM